MPKITPTIGRVMLYHPTGPESLRLGTESLASIVVYVHGAGESVNLAVFTRSGKTFSRLNVPVVQGDEPVPDHSYAAWMPYQLGQAAMTLRASSVYGGGDQTP